MKSLVYILSTFLLVIVTQSCSQGVKGDGNIISKEVSISDYEKISISGAATLVYTQKADTVPYLHIEVDENIYSLLDISSSDNKLSIQPKEGQSINPTKLVIHTNSKDLKNLTAAGSVKIQLNDTLRSTDLTITLAGSCSVIANGSIEYNNISIKTAGSANMTLKGIANTVICNTAGSSDINILDLQAKNVKCKIAGSGVLKAYAEDSLDVEVAGSGKIEYKGNATVTEKIAGSGKIIQID